MKTIEITVSPAGATQMQTKGFTGSSCQDASQFIEQALGQRHGERFTGEFYSSQTTNRVIQEGSSWLRPDAACCVRLGQLTTRSHV